MKIARLDENNELKFVDINKIKPQNITVDQLRKYVEKPNEKNLGYHHPDWPSNIWSKSLDEIVDFLKDRFKTTSDESEYYHVMKLLHRCVPEKELLIPFSSISGDLKKVAVKGKKNKGTVVTPGAKRKSKSKVDKGSKTPKLQDKNVVDIPSERDNPQVFKKFTKFTK